MYKVADWILALDGKKMLPAQITEVMMNNISLFSVEPNSM